MMGRGPALLIMRSLFTLAGCLRFHVQYSRVWANRS